MDAKALVSTRIDTTIKKEAAIVLASFGLTVSMAVRLFLTRVAIDKEMPFEILIPNPKTIDAMNEARDGKLKSFTLDEVINVLAADD
jgi:DNA-damage-inducible protein J